MILQCICVNTFQDKKHGKNMRIHNATGKGRWRCTVCNKEKDGK